MIALPLIAVSLAVSVFTASVPVPATPAVLVAKAGAVLAINAGATAVSQAVAELPVTQVSQSAADAPAAQ